MKFIVLVVLLFCQLFVSGQIRFTVEQKDDNKTYVVKLKPEASYPAPLNITNSAQCSFVVPAGGFKVGNIQNIHGVWTNVNNVVSNTKSPQKDYLIFNLSGHIKDINYTQGEEVPLFTFKNIGTATGLISFVSENDVYLLKDKKLNVGNYISVLGAGLKNAFSGIYGKVGYNNQSLEEMKQIQAQEIENREESEVATYEVSDQVFEFKSNFSDQLIRLDWQAGQIKKTSFFVVEKSMDGVNFKPIKKVENISGPHYKQFDESPDYGINYYRIKQQFNDGNFRYSNIEEEKYFIDQESVNLYPNPVREWLWLRLGHFSEIKGIVRVFSRTGQEMATQNIDPNSRETKINTSQFPNGLYFLIIEGNRQLKTIERQFVVESLE